MRKIKVLSLLAVLFASLCVCVQGVYAAEITNSKYENNRIQLSGIGDTQVQIVLFSLNNSPLYMTTAAVENGKFSITLPEIADLKAGNYTVKVADYDGKNIDSEVITVPPGIVTSNSGIGGIKTGDDTGLCLSCVLLAFISGAILVFLGIQKNVRSYNLKH